MMLFQFTLFVFTLALSPHHHLMMPIFRISFMYWECCVFIICLAFAICSFSLWVPHFQSSCACECIWFFCMSFNWNPLSENRPILTLLLFLHFMFYWLVDVRCVLQDVASLMPMLIQLMLSIRCIQFLERKLQIHCPRAVHDSTFNSVECQQKK